MNSLLSKIRDIGIGFGATLLFAAPVMAQAIDVTTIETKTQVGNLITFENAVKFAINMVNYLGWIGVILGIGLAIFGLIYKLMAAETEESMKTVQGYLTKAVLIAVAGMLLLGFGYIIEIVADFLGVGGLPTITQTGGGDTPGIQ